MVDLGELRSLLVAQSIPSISKPMLIILVSWLVVIFFGFSLIAPPNATTTLARSPLHSQLRAPFS
jgi:hypothetical protein